MLPPTTPPSARTHPPTTLRASPANPNLPLALQSQSFSFSFYAACFSSGTSNSICLPNHPFSPSNPSSSCTNAEAKKAIPRPTPLGTATRRFITRPQRSSTPAILHISASMRRDWAGKVLPGPTSNSKQDPSWPLSPSDLTRLLDSQGTPLHPLIPQWKMSWGATANENLESRLIYGAGLGRKISAREGKTRRVRRTCSARVMRTQLYHYHERERTRINASETSKQTKRVNLMKSVRRLSGDYLSATRSELKGKETPHIYISLPIHHNLLSNICIPSSFYFSRQ